MNNEKCVICEKEYESSKLWKSSNRPWMKICEICWELPFEEKQKKVREYVKKNKIDELNPILIYDLSEKSDIELTCPNCGNWKNTMMEKYGNSKNYKCGDCGYPITYSIGQPKTKKSKFSDFRTQFFKNIDTKTGWGKEQLKKLFDDTYFELSNETINWE